jgi:hypothetical protein
LRFRDAFTVTNSLCGDHAVCQAAGRIATAVAARYNAWSGKRQTGGFWYGANPSASAVAGLVALGKTLDHAGTTEFPLFGSAGRWRFSYSGFALFPLALDGRTYVGAIGHDGVGWRENTVTLLALYIRDGAGLKPVAGFTIDRKIGGLAAAVREAPDALPKRARPD